MIGAPSVEGPRTQWSSTLQFLQSVIVTLIGGEGTSKKKKEIRDMHYKMRLVLMPQVITETRVLSHYVRYR